MAVTSVLEPLRGDAQVQRRRVVDAHVGRHLPHEVQECLLHCGRLGESLPRGMPHADVDEGGQHGVVAGDSELLQVMECAPHLLGAEAGHRHQHVGRDALVGVGVDQRLHDREQTAATVIRHRPAVEPLLRLLDGVNSQTGREDLHPVLLASQQFRLLQPGERGARPRVVGGGVPPEVLVLVIGENLTGAGNHLAASIAPADPAQSPQHPVDLASCEARAGRHSELPLHVVPGVEQHAVGLVLVPSGAARLLQVVLQRGRNVGVYHQPHVGLVDAHAEGVGGRYRSKFAADEGLLDGLFLLGLESGVEAVGGDSLLLQESRHLLGPPAGRAVHDRSARRVGRQMLLQQRVDVVELRRVVGLDHDELEVRATAAAVVHTRLDAELAPEVVDDLLFDLRLGRGGEAQHGRYRPALGSLADEAAHIAVVGAEVVAPLGEAVGLVQDPGPDLALGQRSAKRHASQLLGRYQQYGGVAESQLLQGVGSFGHRQGAVDGDA